jgi:hypothetical protein
MRRRGAPVRAFILGLLLCLTLAVPGSAVAITGGSDATESYPFMGSLQRLDSPRDDLHVCGVALIEPQWAITAGHCARSSADVIDRPSIGHPAGWTVRFGSVDVASGGEVVGVERFVQLNNRYFEDDLALLKLEHPVSVAPITIAGAAPPVGTPARFLGWGMTCEELAERCFPQLLREASTVVQPPDSCGATGSDLCLGSLDGSVSAQNMDSGGPAVVKDGERWTLVGTVEGGGGSGTTYFTGVGEHLGWIRQTIADEATLQDTPFPTDAAAGTVLFDGACTGAVIDHPQSETSDPALVLTNAHCLGDEVPEPGTTVVDRAKRAPVLVKDQHGETVLRASTTEIAFATLSGTDVAVLRLDQTYAQLAESGIAPRSISPDSTTPGRPFEVVSGSSGRSWNCKVQTIVPRLEEAGYTQKSSIRYQGDCTGEEAPSHGDSGSPLVDVGTGLIVGLHATGNDGDGDACSENNPCEVDGRGARGSFPGAKYGQQVAFLTACLTQGSTVDLADAACADRVDELTNAGHGWSPMQMAAVVSGAALVALVVTGALLARRRKQAQESASSYRP